MSGYYTQDEATDRRALVGFLGELAFARQCLAHGKDARWIGGPADHDFEVGDRLVEVKTSVGESTGAFFSPRELRFGWRQANRARWDVAGIELDKSQVEILYQRLVRGRALRIPRFRNEPLSQDSVDARVRHVLFDGFAASSDMAFHQLVLQASNREPRVYLRAPFSKDWAPLGPALELFSDSVPLRLRES